MAARRHEKVEPLDLTTRIALRIDEAAATMGLSEGAFREHILPACPKLYAGRAVVIPKRLFEHWVEQLALEEAPEGVGEGDADELLRRV